MSSNRKPRPPRAKRPVPGGEASSDGVRLQKVIAAAGIASRRAAEELIEAGRVTVDGEIVTVQGKRVDPDKVRIEVDGERLNVSPRYEYIMLNKPKGVVSTAKDPQGRPTVIDLVKSRKRVYPVGRLDIDTLGLVLLTNHGDLAHRLTHPRFEVPRIYIAEVEGIPPEAAIKRLTTGVDLEDGPAKAIRARLVHKAKRRSMVEVTMAEGRKHEVRRMFDAISCPVQRLVRVGFGPLGLGQLPTRASRPLTPDEVGALLTTTGL